MASLHARHGRACPLGDSTRFEEPLDGCTCQPGPTYVFYVRRGKKTDKIRVGKNRKEAERAHRKIAVQEDEGAYQPPKNIRFEEWGEKWLAGLERPNETTKDGYASMLRLANEVFGPKLVRNLRAEDVAEFNSFLRERGNTDSTRAKQLRVLRTCLDSAVQKRYAARNPVQDLDESERPAPARRERPYFESEELPRLFAEVPDGVYRMLFLLALKTGMRQGELVALTWGDVDLTAGVIHVRRNYTHGRLGKPKNRKDRPVDITPDVVEMLGRWWGECGRPDNDTLVLPGDSRDGFLYNNTILRRELYPAMKRAGVPRIGPTGEERTFHSFRHTFAKRALESGADLTWLSRHLGHSSVMVTDGVYGHWERKERKRQMERLAGAFGV